MAVVCTPPRWAIKPRGGPVIVNSRSRYILVARARVYAGREVERRREREGESMKRERGGDREREPKKETILKEKERKREQIVGTS